MIALQFTPADCSFIARPVNARAQPEAPKVESPFYRPRQAAARQSVTRSEFLSFDCQKACQAERWGD